MNNPLIIEILYLLLPFLFLVGGLTIGAIGQIVQRRHLREITRREQELSHMVLSDVRSFPAGSQAQLRATLVCGEAVIASDRLRTFLSGFQLLVGGRISLYLNLMDRARREARLRMLEQAAALGYDAVCNIRLDTCEVGGLVGQRTGVTVEVLASGTAYRLPPLQDQVRF